jgi:hypothetical protein
MEIARVFLDVHMGLAFQGLSKIMAKVKYNPDVLPDGKFTVFINSKQTAFKVLVGKRYLVYHNNEGKRFPLEAIAHFPKHFDGKTINFSAAARQALREKYQAAEFKKHL